ncbi:MAG: hypothetical protein JXB13_03400, partial [Phycisphaerae bacterium]|nr:hypothetical protein [Phycisphaerae bacterium]
RTLEMLKRMCVSILMAALSGVLLAQPVVPAGGAMNAADYTKRVAPGAFIVIVGEDLAPEYMPAMAVPLSTSLNGTSIEMIDGDVITALPLWYVLPTAVAGQLPFGIGPDVQVRVRTTEGVSDWDALSVVPRAPAFFTVDQRGSGRAVALDLNGELVSRENPLKPGHWFSLYVNSLGEVDPPKPAGQGGGDNQPGNPYNLVTDPVLVTIDGRESVTGYAGLTPYLPGLYQVNIFSPYMDLIGDLATVMTVGDTQSLMAMSLPVEPNGFYFVAGGSKFPNGQTKTAVPGPGSAVVFLHFTPEVWGQDGFGAWSPNTHLGPVFQATSGLALTLMNGGAVVYDNNGIENNTFGNYYDNSAGAVPDNEKPGLFLWFSMSNNLDAAFASHFRLTAPTTFDQIIGYFDGNGTAELRFDPANVYNRFRMNIWSNGPGDVPANNTFVGDVFTSDTTAGTFAYSSTGVRRTFSDGAFDELFRMVYTLEQPITLPPGDYWFSHDTAVPEGVSSPSPAPAGARRAATSAVRPVPDGKVSLNR